MENVCVSFGNLLSSVPGCPADLPGVMDRLGLTRTLAWKVLRLSRGKDPLAAAEHVPGQDGVAIVLRAAESAGASVTDIEAVRRSTERLYSMVGEHASSLPELRRLIQGLGSNRRERADVVQRRQAMEANSHIWGVRAAVEFRADIVIDRDSGKTGDRCDRAFIKGFTELMRANDAARWEFVRTYYKRSITDASVFAAPGRAIFPEQARDGVSFLRVATSDPLPAVERRTWPDQSESFDLLPGSVGRTGAINIMLGELLPSFAYRQASGTVDAYSQAMHLRTPVELLVVELHVQRSIYPTVAPTVKLYDMLRAHYPLVNEYGIEPPLMDTEVELVEAGPADRAAPTLEVPRYAEMMRGVYERLECAPADFDVWRVRLRYPPIPTAMVTGFPLPRESV